MNDIQMSGQKYKRTNFDDDDNTSTGGTPPGVTYDPAIAFKSGATFWQKRSNLERGLLVLLLVLTVLVLILAILLATKHVELEKAITTNLCMTQACITVASSVINSLDYATDPCDDFYEYACGGWIKSHPIPSGQSRWGTFGVMWKENQLILKNVLETPLNESQTLSEKKAKIYYQSCMDPNNTIEEIGAQPLVDILTELGGWSISDIGGSFNASKFDLQTAVEAVHTYGLSVFFNLWVGEDEKNPDINMIQFDQSGLGLARDEYLNKTIEDDKILSAYLQFMVDIGELLDGETNNTREEMHKVLEFEQQLAEITTPNEERRDDEKTYHKIKVSDMQERYPFLKWEHYINSIFAVTTYTITMKEEVILFAPEYLTKLTDMLKEMIETDEGKNTLNNYIKWHVVKLFSSYLSKPFIEAKKKFTKVVTGVMGSEEDWRYCVSDTDGVLGYALGALFVQEAFHGDSKEKAEVMIGEVKAAFINNLPNLNWMDEDTRAAAIDKANAVLDMIGFPEYILNATALDARYENLVVEEKAYFMNNIADLKFGFKRNLDRLRKKPDKLSWSMTPPTVNAYYTPTKNEIVFPAGILQAPFYDKAYPKSLNFGGMGVVMGHELTHGFDDQGREYDKTGTLRPWWNNASVLRFKERTQCFIDKYSEYKINGEHVKGKQTLGENIADNGGLKAAYHAYQDWVKRNGKEPLLPGVNMTQQQLFFTAFAQVWCTNNKAETDHMSILVDSHSPAKFRVIGSLSNSKEFAEVFKCKAGSPMNPVKKCEVW